MHSGFYFKELFMLWILLLNKIDSRAFVLSVFCARTPASTQYCYSKFDQNYQDSVMAPPTRCHDS